MQISLGPMAKKTILGYFGGCLGDFLDGIHTGSLAPGLWETLPQISGIECFSGIELKSGFGRYPLVIQHIAIENHHFLRVNPL